MEDQRGRLRALPSVDEVLSRPAVRALEVRVGRAAVKAAVRQAIAAARERILSGAVNGAGELVPDQDVLSRAQREAAPRLRRVINATGVVLHTNLGRAPLHPDAIARVVEVAARCSCASTGRTSPWSGSRSRRRSRSCRPWRGNGELRSSTIWAAGRWRCPKASRRPPPSARSRTGPTWS